MKNRTQSTADYAVEQFVREPSAWAKIRERGEALRPGMQMSAYEGALLQWLVSLQRMNRIVEIGTFMGLSALWMAQGLPKDGLLVTVERDANYARIAREHTQSEPRIQVVESDALEWLRSDAAKEQGPFDVLFIDGEKKSYLAYLEAALPLLNKGALILADNTLLFGAMLGENDARVSQEAEKAMEQFHATLADTTRFRSTLLPTVEGLTVSVVL